MSYGEYGSQEDAEMSYGEYGSQEDAGTVDEYGTVEEE